MAISIPGTAPAEAPTPLLAPAYRWATIGMVALVFLAAFEQLAVTTIMPTVTADLDGRSWYAITFAASLAASVVGMVAGGVWSDLRGPARPMLVSITVFVAGLFVCGLAPTIEVFVTGRLLQGLGSGAFVVALLVLVARVYAPVDHPRIFGAFSAAWVVPSMVGPTVAGVVAEVFTWRWVFLGVVVLAVAATACMGPTLRATPAEHGVVPADVRRRIGMAVLAAVGVGLLNLGGWGLLGLVLVVVAGLGLLNRPGLRVVIGLRGCIAAAFFAAEIYLPLLLQTQLDVPAWLSGITLTAGAFGWAGASQVQARWGPGRGDRLTHRAAMRVGTLILLGGIAGSTLVAALQLPTWAAAAAWVFAGAGMGLQMPRMSAYVLATSAREEQGENSAAMTIADAIGGSTSISISGVLFVATGGGTSTSFVVALGWTTAVALVAVLVSAKTR